MRYILLIQLLVLISCSQQAKQENFSIIHFNKKVHIFNKLTLNDKAIIEFNFVNEGDKPLVIQNVETSCSCTKAKYSKKPIEPLGNGKIFVNYTISHTGVFYKTIKVYYNGKDSPVKLKIKGLVEATNE